MTDITEAMSGADKAGAVVLAVAEQDFVNATSSYLQRGGTIERARMLLDEAAEKLPGNGRTGIANGSLKVGAETGQPNRDGADQGCVAENGQVAGVRPVREPSKDQRAAAKRVANTAAKSILDTFKITMRQGSVVPIGDMQIGSLRRIAEWHNKKAWVSGKEAEVLYILADKAARQAHLPDGAVVRDVFGVADVTQVIEEATKIADYQRKITTVVKEIRADA